jgi:hypothetical protein
MLHPKEDGKEMATLAKSLAYRLAKGSEPLTPINPPPRQGEDTSGQQHGVRPTTAADLVAMRDPRVSLSARATGADLVAQASLSREVGVQFVPF